MATTLSWRIAKDSLKGQWESILCLESDWNETDSRHSSVMMHPLVTLVLFHHTTWCNSRRPVLRHHRSLLQWLMAEGNNKEEVCSRQATSLHLSTSSLWGHRWHFLLPLKSSRARSADTWKVYWSSRAKVFPSNWYRHEYLCLLCVFWGRKILQKCETQQPTPVQVHLLQGHIPVCLASGLTSQQTTRKTKEDI